MPCFAPIFKCRRALRAVVIAALTGLAVPAWAQQVTTPAPPPAASAGPITQIEGFRSAKFGMSDAELRAAIVRDFNLKGEAIKSVENPVDHTQVLTITVPNLLPKGGKAEVNYVLGYKSKKLRQVTVLWSTTADSTITSDTLIADSNLLQTYFQESHYKPESVTVNAPLNTGGFLVFRGADDKDRMTLLTLTGPVTAGPDNQRSLKPVTLRLDYVEDLTTPDVYKLPPGQF